MDWSARRPLNKSDNLHNKSLTVKNVTSRGYTVWVNSPTCRWSTFAWCKLNPKWEHTTITCYLCSSMYTRSRLFAMCMRIAPSIGVAMPCCGRAQRMCALSAHNLHDVIFTASINHAQSLKLAVATTCPILARSAVEACAASTHITSHSYNICTYRQ